MGDTSKRHKPNCDLDLRLKLRLGVLPLCFVLAMVLCIALINTSSFWQLVYRIFASKD